MYELHMPTMMLAQMSLHRGAIDKETARREFKRALINLKMGIEMLKHEPDGTFENQVYHGAKDSVNPLEKFIDSL